MDIGSGAFVGAVLVTVAALLPITNPPGNAPIFLALTEGLTETERASLARRVGINCFALLVASSFVGTHILAYFDISLSVVRVAGGLLVAATGWRLLNTETSGSPEPRPPGRKDPMSQAFYPLSFPLTVGPGSISIAITLGASLPQRGVEALLSWLASAIGVAVVAAAIYLAFRFAQRFIGILGATGTVVFLRLSAFILLCIGVQICWDGVSELLAPWKPK